MSPRMGRTGGAAARGFGKGTAGPRGPSGPPSNFSVDVTENLWAGNSGGTTTVYAGFVCSWTNGDTSPGVTTEIYSDNYGIYASLSAGVITKWSREFSVATIGLNVAYTASGDQLKARHVKNGTNSAASNAASFTTRGYPTIDNQGNPTGMIKIYSNLVTPSTWNNSYNMIYVIGGGEASVGTAGGKGSGCAGRVNVSLSGTTTVTCGTGGRWNGAGPTATTFHSTPSISREPAGTNSGTGTVLYNGGNGAAGGELGGGGGGSAGFYGAGSNASGATGGGWGGPPSYDGGAGGVFSGDFGENGDSGSGAGGNSGLRSEEAGKDGGAGVVGIHWTAP